MTRQDFLVKWGVYVLTPVPAWFLELLVPNRFPLLGAVPMLLPLAAVCVAMLEGITVETGFGLFMGILCDVAYFNTDGVMTVGLCLIGAGTGALTRYVPRQNLVGCLLCSFVTLALIDGVHIIAHLLAGRGELVVILDLTRREILWSLVFVFPVHALLLQVFRRVLKKTVL